MILLILNVQLGCTSSKNDKDINIKHILYRLLAVVALSISTPALSIDIIANPSVDTETLTVTQLRRIYTMRQVSWADGSPISVFVLPSKHVIHQQFSKEILRIFPYQLDRIWNKLIFSGLGVGPTVVNSKEELMEKITSIPGAIGYVDKLNEEGNVVLIQIPK